MHYTVILEREEDGGYHAFCAGSEGMPHAGRYSGAGTREHPEAMGLYIESLKAHGEEAPTEDILIKPVEIAA